MSAARSEFAANYKARHPRWGWKRRPHRLVQLMLKRLFNREQDGIQIVPTELNLDPVDGHPNNNGAHPNPTGYAQIGASFYSWMKSKLWRYSPARRSTSFRTAAER